MKRLFVIGISIVIVGVSVYVWFAQKHAVQLPSGEPTFAWIYSESETEGIPYTEISVEATYANGVTQQRIIDTIEGGCNVYEDEDGDVYENSSMIICYYAGLGRYYKIVESENTYLVKRKIFEEASPDFAPPVREFETVVQF